MRFQVRSLNFGAAGRGPYHAIELPALKPRTSNATAHLRYTDRMTRWVHLATAPNSTVAEMWIGILRDEGIHAMIRPSDAVSFLGVTAVECRVQVIEEELDRAREVLGEDAD